MERPVQKALFLKIPLELREQILCEVIETSNGFNPIAQNCEKLASTNIFPLLLTCLQLCHEARALLPRLKLEYRLETNSSGSALYWELLPAFRETVDDVRVKAFFQGARLSMDAPDYLENLFFAGPGSLGLPTKKFTNVKVFDFEVHSSALLSTREQTLLAKNLEITVMAAFDVQRSCGEIGRPNDRSTIPKDRLAFITADMNSTLNPSKWNCAKKRSALILDAEAYGWWIDTARCFINGELVVALDYLQYNAMYEKSPINAAQE